jgi:hypothetical protein
MSDALRNARPNQLAIIERCGRDRDARSRTAIDFE